MIESEENSKNTKQWTLYVDDASNKNRSRADTMFVSPKGHKIHCALFFMFQASNNEAKHEALIAGLRLARELRPHNLKVYSYS